MSYIGQREDEWEAKQKKIKREAAKPKGPFCACCDKRMRDLGGLKQHLRDAHSYTPSMWLEYLDTHQKKRDYTC
jgi:hypothetical protein